MGLTSFFCLIFFITTTKFIFGDAGTKLVCDSRERQALLDFKQGLIDPSNKLSSWTGEDCCSWVGIQCNTYNTTRRIVRIDLQNPYDKTQEGFGWQLGGEINSSLLELKHLKYLDLSLNAFEGVPIPDFFGSLQNLRYLDLSNAGFSGTVPPQLGNLSSLCYLNLSVSQSATLLDAKNIQWLSKLSSLQYLDLSFVNLSLASDHWVQVTNMLPSLLELRLSGCLLNRTQSVPKVNFTSLKILDLSFNDFTSARLDWLFSLDELVYLDLVRTGFQRPVQGTYQNLKALEFLDLSHNTFDGHPIPDWVFNITSLKFLDLGYNDHQGMISAAIGNLTSLEVLYLRFNQLSSSLPPEIGNLKRLETLSLEFNSFTGFVPMSIGRLSSLRTLDLSNNLLNGTLPGSLWQLSNLEYLSFHNNSLTGVVAETHFTNLTKLTDLVASSNSLVLEVSSGWIPPFRLTTLQLGSWKLEPHFPTWLRTQENLTTLDLSSTGISDYVPTWFWNMTSHMSRIDLSHNQLKGKLPSMLNSKHRFSLMFLSSNKFEGPLPRISSNVNWLDISNNSISGPLSLLLCNPLNTTNSLEALVLSDNRLSGELPQCWMYWQSLKLIKLDNNNLRGRIPSSIGSLSGLLSLHLENNTFHGELPLWMQNYTDLRILDLGENEFSGSIPAWMGAKLQVLQVLRLRSNKFYGDIPSELCFLTSLQVLDMAHNNLSGKIPRCFGNFSAMTIKQNSSNIISYYSFEETSLLTIKGIEVKVSNNLRLETIMDLSVNNVSGEIPEGLTNLLGLQVLNLSNNLLMGKIPGEIGDMGSLESLDFSMNQLSDMIPQSMSNLNYLSYLNLSFNNLFGEIPSSTQLQSFHTSSYISNVGLCGPPLEEKCKRNETSEFPNDGDSEDDESSDDVKLFYLSIAVGFVLGSWGLWGVLFFKKSWRFSYFRFIDDMIDKLCTKLF